MDMWLVGMWTFGSGLGKAVKFHVSGFSVYLAKHSGEQAREGRVLILLGHHLFYGLGEVD